MTPKQIKQLECLYAWSEFYDQNNRPADFHKTERQIAEFKRLYEYES